MSDELFDDLDRQAPAVPAPGPARYETANRTQVELTPTDLEALLPPGHAARLVWRFVEGLDLAAFYAGIKAREGGPGRAPIDPKLLVALWLYATIDGVGSAREVDRLCTAHDAYRWLRGGVSVNYHTLSDFRVAHHAALDDLLTESIATLRHRGVVTLARVAQDGTRVRASAGVGSFRREGTLQERLTEARKLVERTARQQEGGLSRDAAAQARAAAEGLARVEEALAQLPAVAEAKRRNRSTSAPRTSTTDPDARVMKMADGGYRPAYNIQVATDQDSDAVLGVAVTNVGSDQQQLVPMLDQVTARGLHASMWLVDAGYVSDWAVESTAALGTTLIMPVPRAQGADTPLPIRATDSLGGRRVESADADRRGRSSLSLTGRHGRTEVRGLAYPSAPRTHPAARPRQGPYVDPLGRARHECAHRDGDRAALDDVGPTACAPFTRSSLHQRVDRLAGARPSRVAEPITVDSFTGSEARRLRRHYDQSESALVNPSTRSDQSHSE